MSSAIKHEKRRDEILTKALDVFVEEGFENTTFQKIADRCDITRTTLYIYFKNKKDIFNYSIKLLLEKVEGGIRLTQSDTLLSSVEKITKVLLDILGHLEENRKLLYVILDYLLHMSKTNVDPGKRVRRRTIRLRHILASLVIDGIKTGDIKPVSVKTAGDFLYGFIDAAIFRLVVLRQENLGELRKTVGFAVKQFATSQ
ncbi:MAG: TetR/AcrR family transcriptional regulator [Treponema sp.]|nr:TetR/AcrR family transcriptional regulator [Treponema sp.]